MLWCGMGRKGLCWGCSQVKPGGKLHLRMPLQNHRVLWVGKGLRQSLHYKRRGNIGPSSHKWVCKVIMIS